MIDTFEGYSLSWVKYVAGAVDNAIESVRQWVIGTMKRIGRLMGVSDNRRGDRHKLAENFPHINNATFSFTS